MNVLIRLRQTASARSALSLAAALLLGTVCTALPARAGNEPPMCGDAVANGTINASDALAVLRAAVGTFQCTTFVCDANGNGSITATDSLLVLKFAVGNPVTLSCPTPDTTTTTTTSTSSSSSSSTTSTTSTTMPPTTTTVIEPTTTTVVDLTTTTLEPTTTTQEPTTTTQEPTTTTAEPTTTTAAPTTTTILLPTTTVPPTSTTLPAEIRNLRFELSTSVVVAGGTVTFVAEVIDGNDDPVLPQPDISVVVTADGANSGPGPEIIGNGIATDALTRGNFDVTATAESLGLSRTLPLAVVEPTPMNEAVSEFGSMLPPTSHALFEAAGSVEAGSQSGLEEALDQLRMILDALDLERLELVTPLSPPGGFPPSLSEVQGAGFGGTAGDATWISLINQLIAQAGDLRTYLASLDPSNVTDAQIDQLEQKTALMQNLLAQLLAVAPTVFAGISAEDEVNVLMSKALPELFAQVLSFSIAMGESSTVSNAPALPPSGWIASVLSAIGPRQAHAAFLFDVVGAMGIQGQLISIVDRIYGKIIEDLENMVALLVLEGLLDDYAATSLCDAQGSASVSVSVPEYPGSWLEGTAFNTDPQLNQVLFVGPEAPQQARNIIQAFNPSEVEDLDDMFEFFNGIKEAFESAGEAYQNANRRPDSYNPFQGVMCDFDYPLLVFDGGFPDVLGDCTICASPVLILHHDVTQGGWSLITENFVK